MFEAAVFEAAFGVGREVHDHDFGPWEPWTRFALVRDLSAGGAVVAVVRFILPGPLGSQTLYCARRPPWAVDDSVLGTAGVDWASTWDVATIAVRPGSARQIAADGAGAVDPALVAWHAILRAAVVNSVSTMAAVLDERVRAVMATMGLVVHDLPGCRPRPFEGSAASTPVFRPVAALVVQQRRENPEAHQQVMLGQNLGQVDLPTDDHFRVTGPVDLRAIDLRSRARRPGERA